MFIQVDTDCLPLARITLLECYADAYGHTPTNRNVQHHSALREQSPTTAPAVECDRTSRMSRNVARPSASYKAHKVKAPTRDAPVSAHGSDYHRYQPKGKYTPALGMMLRFKMHTTRQWYTGHLLHDTPMKYGVMRDDTGVIIGYTDDANEALAYATLATHYDIPMSAVSVA